MRIDEPRNDEFTMLKWNDFGFQASLLGHDFLHHRIDDVLHNPFYFAGGRDGKEAMGQGVICGKTPRVDDSAMVYCWQG